MIIERGIKFITLAFLCVILALSAKACSSAKATQYNNYAPHYSAPNTSTHTIQQATQKQAYYYAPQPVQCVPYAREVSGINLMGNAHHWWNAADAHRYPKGKTPGAGAVLVLKNTGKLRYGHLAVVTRVLSNRDIEVTHSNWGSSHQSRKIIYNAMRVKDVSPNNDWSRVRFWDYPSKSFGFPYDAYGFIYNPHGRKQS
jgi:surface antigen